MDAAEAEARRRFKERAVQVLEDLEETYFDTLAVDHTAAEAVLLAHLMTASDGYKEVLMIADWSRRPRAGWVTSVTFRATLDHGLTVPFALEARHYEHARQLAVTIDRERPGERLPGKLRREHALIASNYRVISFTELEILADPVDCRERVEGVLLDMVDDVLTDAGIMIQGSLDTA